MINFRVSDLDAMVEQLRAAKIDVAVDPETYPNGRFTAFTMRRGTRSSSLGTEVNVSCGAAWLVRIYIDTIRTTARAKFRLVNRACRASLRVLCH